MPAAAKRIKVVKVLVCGGRAYSDYAYVELILAGLVAEASAFFRMEADEVHVIFACGAAHGADMLATQFAKKHGHKIKLYPADWKTHGRSAGPIRNKHMLDDFKPDMIVGFPGGNGTEHMCKIGQEAGIPVRQWRVTESPANAGMGIKNEAVQ